MFSSRCFKVVSHYRVDFFEIDIDSRETGFFSSDFGDTWMMHPGFSQSQGTKFIFLNVLINGTRSCPDRVVDILEACGALDLSSSLSRDVKFILSCTFSLFSSFSFDYFSFYLVILRFISSYFTISHIIVSSFFDSVDFPCLFFLTTFLFFLFSLFRIKKLKNKTELIV